jgi:hypothetical protein
MTTDAPTTTPAAPTGMGISIPVPTELVPLPSKGRYYPEDHPLHNTETLELRYMTARDEDTLTSPSLLRKGLAVDRMLKNLIVDPAVETSTLLIGDKNALILAARISGYGDNYTYTMRCPQCTTRSKQTTDLQIVFNQSLDQEVVTPAEVTDHNNGTFSTTLPKSGWEITFRLTTGADEKRLAQLTEAKKKKNLPETTLTDTIKLILNSVNGNNDRLTISRYVDSMPAADSRHFRTLYQDITPDLNMDVPFECPTCFCDEEVSLPLTAEFFWPQ